MKVLQYREAWLMSKARKWQIIAVYSVLLALLMILAGIKYQGVNWQYCGTVRYIEPEVEAEAESGTQKNEYIYNNKLKVYKNGKLYIFDGINLSVIKLK